MASKSPGAFAMAERTVGRGPILKSFINFYDSACTAPLSRIGNSASPNSSTPGRVIIINIDMIVWPIVWQARWECERERERERWMESLRLPKTGRRSLMDASDGRMWGRTLAEWDELPEVHGINKCLSRNSTPFHRRKRSFVVNRICG